MSEPNHLLFVNSTMNKNIIFVLLLFSLACNNSDVSPICEDCYSPCPIEVEINPIKYQLFSYPIEISDAYVDGDCVYITYSFTGCGESLELKLYDSGIVTASNPSGREINLVLGDASGGCESTFEKYSSFNILPLRNPGDTVVALHLNGWSGELYYSYGGIRR